MEIRVAVVDDERLFCDGVRMMVESQPDMRFTGAAHDGEAAIATVQRERPDVVLMDVRMPRSVGIAATARILDVAGADAPAVLVLTTIRSDEAVAAATRAGAAGFLLKDTTAETLLDAVRTVHAGQSVFACRSSTEVLRESRTVTRTPVVDALDPLTPRERQVFLDARAACPTHRSLPSRLSARRPAKPMSPISSPSSGCARASSSSPSPSTRDSSDD